MSNKSLTVSLLVVLIVAIGGYIYPQAQSLVQGISTSGSNFNGPSDATAVTSLLTSTSTSIQNTGGNDRAITSDHAFCQSVGTSNGYLTGGGIASLTLQAATTSVANQGLQGNTNYVFNTTIATTSGLAAYYVASSTEPIPSYIGRIWPAGSWLTFNTNATNTAACSFSVHFIGL